MSKQVEPELKTGLLPCPLFGHEPSKDEWPTGPHIAVSGAPNMPTFYAIVCPSCCSTAYDEDKERVIKKWNTRVPVDSVAPRVDVTQTVSELARAIAAIFFPADWRLLNYSHYQRLVMVEELLRAAGSNAINRADAVRVLQEARERGNSDLRELISELRSLPAAPATSSDSESPPVCVCAITPNEQCPIHSALAAASPAPKEETKTFDLDPLEFWCDLAEVLGHPRPSKVNPVSLIAEVGGRLNTGTPPAPAVSDRDPDT